jgi:recombination protein RecA
MTKEEKKPTLIKDVINNKHRKYSFYVPEEYGRDFPRIPTGIFPLDYSWGGGAPIGVTSSVYGPPSSNKSGIATLLLASSQKICWNCFEYLWDCQCGNQIKKKSVIVQTERFDLDWAEALGLNLDELIIAEPCSGEEAVDIIYEVLKAEDCGLVVLDSLSRVIPEQEITDPALSYQVGMRARLHTKLINKVKSVLIQQKRNGINTAFMATNQIRANIGAYGGGEEITGGFASKHDWHLTCRMSQLKTKPEYVDKESELPLYGKFKASLISPGIKRKLFTLAGTCEFFMAMQDTPDHKQGTIYDFKTTFEYADKANLIDRTKWSFKYDELEFNTKTELMNYWIDNPQHYLTVKRRIVDHYIALKKGVLNAT